MKSRRSHLSSVSNRPIGQDVSIHRQHVERGRAVMKCLFAVMLAMVAWPLAARSQSAADPNEGSVLTPLGSNNYQFTWWARPGVYYLVEVSHDLVTWSYIDTVFLGAGGVSAPVHLNVGGNCFFVRLNTDPFHTDVDRDGMPDAWEILHGLDPRLNDADGDPDSDQLTSREEYLLGINPALAADTRAVPAASVALSVHTDLH